ncbi:hypothetical protein DN464_15870 [Enterobacter cloacae]|uniref:gp53-like domain-containing protein n=7 Tax=Enterobacter roggenkampii TaxID=1812935 RepID=UPI000666285F|nr:hypothetical protein [Enterobacter roggenkampii]RWT43190.1 hypothetical protein DN464_15870 [Enterobacter cloacae]HAS1013556.1 hypothetical protein [Enterobacter roggenkampii]HEM8080874.1 hypothetical protein [Enterobacter roggenkampii]HEM8094312.1 hypothetical protein [Enterobacter roggenkampii]HEM8109679.1 hypothetical protein [Enterobacter roggenkampii]
MLRIGQVEATATQDGKYTDGSVAGGIAATRLRAAAFNAMQEELAHIVESAGLALDINDMTQVLKAIQKLTLSRANPFADIKSDGAAAISTALTNLGLKSAAQRDVGTGTNQIPDMNSFTSGTNWMKFPSGKIIQWGYQTSSSSGSVVVNFPIPFPTQCFGVTGAGTDASAANIAGCQLIDKSGFYLSAWLVAAGSVFNRTTTNISWIAVGI